MSENILKYDGQSFKSEEAIEKIRHALTGTQYQQIPIKTPQEIEKLKISGNICAKIL